MDSSSARPTSALDLLLDALGDPVRAFLLEERTLLQGLDPFLHVPECPRVEGLVPMVADTMVSFRDGLTALLACPCVARLVDDPCFTSSRGPVNFTSVLELLARAVPDVRSTNIFELCKLDDVMAAVEDSDLVDHPALVLALAQVRSRVETEVELHGTSHGRELIELLVSAMVSRSCFRPDWWIPFLCPGMTADPVEDPHSLRLLEAFVRDHRDRLRDSRAPELAGRSLLVLDGDLLTPGGGSVGKVLHRLVGLLFGNGRDSYLVPAELFTGHGMPQGLVVDEMPPPHVLETVRTLLRDGTDPAAALRIAEDIEA